MLTLYSPAPCVTHEASVLPFSGVSYTIDTALLPAPTGVAWLLVEAIELAEQFGYRVVESELDGEAPGVRFPRGRKQLWFDLCDAPESRLATIAESLRGEPGLAFAEMSRELSDYLTPRRAA